MLVWVWYVLVAPMDKTWELVNKKVQSVKSEQNYYGPRGKLLLFKSSGHLMGVASVFHWSLNFVSPKTP